MSEGVRVELEDEITTVGPYYARVCVYKDDMLVAEVHAKIDQEQGADGGYYGVVKLKKV